MITTLAVRGGTDRFFRITEVFSIAKGKVYFEIHSKGFFSRKEQKKIADERGIEYET